MAAPAETTYRQLLLAAQLIAKPEYVSALFPADTHSQAPDLRVFDSAAAKAVIGILSAHGSAYATPLKIQAALADLALDLDEDEVLTLVQLVPDADDVTLDAVKAARDDIVDTYNLRKLGKDLYTASQQVLNGKVPAAEVVANVEQATRTYRQSRVGRATTADAIDARLKDGKSVVRYQIAKGIPGGEFLDTQGKGLRPDGTFGYGLLGRGEIEVIVALYGVGKTRWGLNQVASLLDDGARVGILVLEDTEATYSFNLMGIRWDLEPWLIEKHDIVGKSAFIAEHGIEMSQRVEQARQWFRDLKDQLAVIDGGANVNIFEFRQAKALLQEEAEVNGRTHLLIDYVQQWPGDLATQEAQGFGLRELASRYNVGLVLLSQLPADAQDYTNVQAGTLPTKGTRTYAQIAHWGYLLGVNPKVGQRELIIQQMKGRKAGLNSFAAVMNVETGKVLRYEGASMFTPSQPEGGKNRRGSRDG